MPLMRIELEVEQSVWAAAEPIIAQTSLTPSTFFQGVLRRIVNEECIHMDHFSPSAETLEAMRECESGELKTCTDIKALIQELRAEEE